MSSLRHGFASACSVYSDAGAHSYVPLSMWLGGKAETRYGLYLGDDVLPLP